jgi:Septum formation
MRVRLAPVGLLLLAVGLVGCSKDFPGNELDVGDCVQDLDALENGNSTVNCDDEHVFELFAKVELDDDDFPGEDEIESQAAETCRGQDFEDYVGVPYVESEWFAYPRWPTESGWEQGNDRTILCFVTTEDLSPTTGSVEGSNQ